MPDVQSACDTFCCEGMEIRNSSIPEMLAFAMDYDLPALLKLCEARINSPDILGIIYGAGGEQNLSNLPGAVAAKLMTSAADLLRKMTENVNEQVCLNFCFPTLSYMVACAHFPLSLRAVF